ncbi:cation:dicarboxylate symporter family transporter [Streptomyces sp. NPDC101151]|uniref:cation:dicarboxylate symporter family transporter n=1 Tax=Streptomyces sp. NPDC101151 TaxID=3366115 RepID=UPI0038163434
MWRPPPGSARAAVRTVSAATRRTHTAHPLFTQVASTAALLVGPAAANLVGPGSGLHVDPAGLDVGALDEQTRGGSLPTTTEFILNVLPDSFVGAFADNALLLVLVPACLVGTALLHLGLIRMPRILPAIEQAQGLMLTSKGMAGAADSAFLALSAIAGSLGVVPAGAVALLLGVDRIMDSMRVTTDLLGKCVAVFAVSRWEGALNAERAKKVLDGEIVSVPEEGPEAGAAVPVSSVKEPAPKVG